MQNINEEKYEVRITKKLNIIKNSCLIFPMVDSHMHIQSNDISPLPIMEGIVRCKINKSGIPDGQINYVELTSRREFNRDSGYYYDYDPVKDNLYDESRGKKGGISFGLETMPIILSRKTLTNITANLPGSTGQYGKVTRSCSYLIAGIYQNEMISSNLAFPSCWINAYTSKEDEIKSNNNERKNLIRERINPTEDRKTLWYMEDTLSNHCCIFLPKFSCIMGMELMYAHYWGIYGIPLYIYDIDGKIYTVDNFPTYNHLKISSRGEEHNETGHLCFPYDVNIEEAEIDLYTKRDANFNKYEDGDFPYSIFLREIDTSESYQFEDHTKHITYQKVVALKFPFRFFPFYHFDPRRFFAPIDEISVKNFRFFVKDKGSGKYLLNTSINNVLMKNNSNVGFTYQLNPKSIFEQFVEHKGLFWGIKLYVALGYPPYIGCGNDYHAIFPKLSKDSYSGFIVFLEDCAKEKIPITCHASPQGMTIADSEIYLKEYLKTNKKSSYYTAGKSNFDPNIKGMYLGFGIIDDFSSPDSWRIVLSKIEKYSLRLCLAHFGGKPFFTNEYEMDSNKPYCWQDKLGQLIKDYENKHEIYTDLSNYMFNPVIFPCVLPDFTFKRLFENSKLREYFDKTTKNHYSQSFDYYKCRLPLNNIENCIDKEQKRAALQICFIMLENGIIGKDINAAASKLAELISKYPVLQYRIMYGTDYPLSENGGVKGVENYQSSTFIFYQLVTHKLGSKWDVWHQFCVINPLKFLGLLKLEGEEYKFDATKLIKFKENLITYNAEIKDTYIRTNRWGLEEVNTVKNVIDSKFNEFINTNSDSDLKNELNGKVIPKAEEMVDEDNCLIITGEKVNWNEN